MTQYENMHTDTESSEALKFKYNTAQACLCMCGRLRGRGDQGWMRSSDAWPAQFGQAMQVNARPSRSSPAQGRPRRTTHKQPVPSPMTFNKKCG